MRASQAGSTLFSSPQPSDETLIATVGTTPSHELFCHRKQTDQLLLLQGEVLEITAAAVTKMRTLGFYSRTRYSQQRGARG